jgi:hypothetical protein
VRTLAIAAASWVRPGCIAALLWSLVVIATAAALAAVPGRAVRGDGVWLIGLWIALAGAAYAERRHLYAENGIAAFLIAALFLLARRRAPCTALALGLAIVCVAHPFGHLLVAVPRLRLDPVWRPAGAVALPAVERGHGVWVDPGERSAIRAVERFVDDSLQPGETWFDFSNQAALYYLFDRPCPVRHDEVAFFESAAAQREVIAALARDRSVRAVLIGFPAWSTAIDGIPNRVRAPLVWRYLGEHFAPAFDEHGVIFWSRKGPP